MIKTIFINNIAIIDYLEINFSKGFNIITGESGSGKSILIKSIEYLKGKKFNKDDFRKNADFASIKSIINIDDLDYSIERKISKKNISTFYVNNKKIKFEDYVQLVQNSIDIHNQNDHHNLLDKSFHIKYLDAFADNSLILKKIDSIYTDWQKTKNELSALLKQKENYNAKKELYQFQNDELSKMDLEEGMEEKLMSNYHLLFNSKKIKEKIEVIKCNLSNDLSDSSISSKLSDAIKNIEDIVKYGKDFKILIQG